jgi:hypothetical protein
VYRPHTKSFVYSSIFHHLGQAFSRALVGWACPAANELGATAILRGLAAHAGRWEVVKTLACFAEKHTGLSEGENPSDDLHELDHLPLYRQAQIFARDGLGMDRSTLAGWVGKSAALLEPLANAITRHVLSGQAIFADDAPVKMLVSIAE